MKYILDRKDNPTSEKTFPVNKFRLIYDSNLWRVFENKDATPRYFLASNYLLYNSKEEFEKIFFSESFNPLTTVLTEEKIKDFNPTIQNKSGSTVRLLHYLPNEITLKTETKIPEILFLSDTYYPGWEARVDGRETKIYKANYAFRSLVVPSGTHRIVVKYKPTSFYLGAKISIISLILLIAVAIILSNKKIPDEK